jgi:oligopeptide transport system substrate-binding protein
MANRKGKHYQLPVIAYPAILCLIASLLLFSACDGLKKTKTEPFYAENPKPPQLQEFRWSNGKMPKSFDPARAAASPETDFVRALYEGLTDIDSKTLQPVPAVAAKWTNSEDFKTWTFNLRKDAKWSNGEIVTATDFVRSWKRLIELGEKVPQRGLLKNIVGMDTENVLPIFASEEVDALSRDSSDSNAFLNKKQTSGNSNTAAQTVEPPKTEESKSAKKTEKQTPKKDFFGVEALNDFTLKVSLVQPDKNFPSLTAHPIFRPVYGDGKEFDATDLSADIITNGAFRVSAIEPESIVLDRADYYWNAREVELERVRFVASENAENALAAYRAGDVDVVTNADFKPLALKLLTPYDDFRRTTHSAIVYYVFNQTKKPFDDARIRRALTIAVERERLTEDDMDGASHPAFSFSLFAGEEKIAQDVAEAQRLLSEAGYAEGKDFPVIRLLVNRNDMQKRIARSVAKMWKKNLNIETEIIIKDQADFEAAYQNGEYDIARRGVVLPTTDETANMLAMFPPKVEPEIVPASSPVPNPNIAVNNQILTEKSAESNLNLASPDAPSEQKTGTQIPNPVVAQSPVLTEQQALETLPAIPLSFPTSYSLVKPYVQGFETNSLDAPSLKNVKINNNWQPGNQKLISNE